MKTMLGAMLMAAGTTVLLLLCGGSAAAESMPKCKALVESKIDADRIGLPTRGAVITRAQEVGGLTGGEAASSQAYCLVSGEIMPVDRAAATINFQVALPASWNGKALMLGGGGFDGVVPQVTGNYMLSSAATPTPLSLGYAVFGGDGGHENQTPAGVESGLDAAFMLNDEAYRNYIGDALKKTRDAAMVVIEAAYGRRPAKAYFEGGSKGGGEAMTVAARWPEDWDGVIAWFPDKDYVLNILAFLRNAEIMAAPDAYLDLAKRALLRKAALEACDGLDGIRDGIISNETACRQKFDPATATVNGALLRCPAGRDTGDTCLSDAQLNALKTIESPIRFGFMPGEPMVFPGFNVLTADLGASEQSPLNPWVQGLTMGTAPPSFPTGQGNWFGADFADRFFRFAVTKNRGFNYLTVNASDPGPLTPRLQELARLDQAGDDLSGFARRGGKLIVIQGTADMLISPRLMEQYYQSIRARMGAATVDRFLRFYEVPGFGHGAATVFNARLDALSLLTAWVERDDDPAQKTIVTDAGHGGRTRPLCPYPSWPRYKAAGDPDIASSFVCAQP